MLLNDYLSSYVSKNLEKNVSGYFIEKFLYFKRRKKNVFNFFFKFIHYNSDKTKYFYFLNQCYLRNKFEKFKNIKNLVSRLNLLKLRLEPPSLQSLQISDQKILHKKIYGSFNSLNVVTLGCSYFLVNKMKIIFKKLFFDENFKAISIWWFYFFKKINRVLKESYFNFSNLVRKFVVDLSKFVKTNPINKLISNSKNHSWANGTMNLLKYKRKSYGKKNTILYIRTGLLKITSINFSGHLLFLNIKDKKKSNFLKMPFSFSIDQIFSQINQNSDFHNSKFFSSGFYGFKILASKKKLPLKIYSPMFFNLEINKILTSNWYLEDHKSEYFLKRVFEKSKINHRNGSFLNYKFITIHQQQSHMDSMIFNQLIFKEADDFHNEFGATLLLSQFEKILREYQIDMWLTPLCLSSFQYNGGSVEVISNSNSIHEIKSFDLLKLNQKKFIEKSSIENFLESLSGYSLVCYLLQIKDRHNANILLNLDNRVVHIDFGFLLGLLPGNLKLEATSFKMSENFISMLNGKKSQFFDMFREFFVRGFLIIRKNLGKLDKISRSFIFQNFLDYRTKSRLSDFVKRFSMRTKVSDTLWFGNKVYNDSLEDWRTRQYDKYQLLASGIRI